MMANTNGSTQGTVNNKWILVDMSISLKGTKPWHRGDHRELNPPEQESARGTRRIRPAITHAYEPAPAQGP